MPSAGSTGTEVNRAVTLYELRHSPGINVTYWPVQQSLGYCGCGGGIYLPVA